MDFTFSKYMEPLSASAIREILKFASQPGAISFAAGSPASESFPIEEIKGYAKDALEENPIVALSYNMSEGYPPLRAAVTDHLSKRYSIGNSEYDEVIITTGAQQSIELVCKCLCSPGDTIVCDNPTFLGSIKSFNSYGVNILGIPMEEDGINIDLLEEALQQNKVKIIYQIPNFQNPSGRTVSLEKRKAIVALAVKYNVLVLEDNPYGELRFAGEELPSMKSMDTTGNVAYCGTFSKILSPGLRVGFVVCQRELANKITVGKQCSDVNSPVLNQMICEKFLTQIDFKKHIEKISKIYKAKSELMISCMNEHFPSEAKYSVPKGGMFIWVTLPEQYSGLQVSEAAKTKLVGIVPGNAFMCGGEPSSAFRMNYSSPTDENIIKGVKLLGECLREIMD